MGYKLEVYEYDHYFERLLLYRQINTLCIDVDSTGCAIEGLDEVARRKGNLREVQSITTEGLEGGVPWGVGFQRRLKLIQLTKEDVQWLAGEYIRLQTPGLKEIVQIARLFAINVLLVTGAPENAIRPLAEEVGIPQDHVFAEKLIQDDQGYYTNIDRDTPLADGRKDLLVDLLLRRGQIREPIAGVGDSKGDIVAVGKGMRIGFGGHVVRPDIPDLADVFIPLPSLFSVLPLIIGKEGVREIVDYHPLFRATLWRGLEDLRLARFNRRAVGIERTIIQVRKAGAQQFLPEYPILREWLGY